VTPRRIPKRDDAAGRAYGELRDALLSGVLRPGERIDLGAVAHWLDMSRTPVDHAITRLCTDGLVTVEPYRGTFVRPGDPERFEATAQVLDIVHDAVLAVVGSVLAPAERGRLLDVTSAAAAAAADEAPERHDRWLLLMADLAGRVGNDVLAGEEARLRTLVQHARVGAPPEVLTAHARRRLESLRGLGGRRLDSGLSTAEARPLIN
jgi:DNA-binding GntR family transcriptional regulator